ncbi:MAG TPA: 4-aminobutyrate--2-oxoglutarate transaminase [Candidatus Dormibacteraeota bacterium]|nr:4-aminobutyrate--2-oxoglutarate transaminase [Candidatus Dormibacteraeota bacterium]
MAIARSESSVFLELRQREIPRGVSTAHPIVAQRADGARLWDVDGNEYLDFAGGIGVLNLGHRHPQIVEAIRAQLEQFIHVSFQVAIYEGYVRVAERLNRLAPGDAPKKTMLVSTGAEAVENAVKIARAFTGRPAVVTFQHGYHGRTLLTLTMTGKTSPYKQSFGPYCPEVYQAPYPYDYRGWTTERALSALDELFEAQVAPERVAAIVIEPVAGEGGFIPAPPEFLRELRARTERHGIMLVADEIQTGFGRTGTIFAIEHAGVVPDLICVAKSLAGGLPLAGVIGRADVMDAPEPGGLGGTYGGNPLACAAALATLDVFERQPILARARDVGERLHDAFRELARRHEQIGDVRALGAMVALELVEDRASKRPAGRLAAEIQREARERGLLLMRAGNDGCVIRILAPLVMTDEELDMGLARLHESCAAVLRS